MESSRRSSSRLKDRLARMFRSPSLLRSTCNTSTSAAPAASRCLISDAALDDDDSVGLGLGLGRSLSFPVRNELGPFPGFVGRRRRLSVDCRLGGHYPSPLPTTKTVTVEKGEEGAPASPCFIKAMEEDEVERKRKRKKKNKKKRFLSNGYGFSSSSSAESDDGDGSGGFFSSEDDEEGGEQKKEEDETATETTFLSSRSFSSDSSEFYQNPKNKNKNKNKRPHHLPAPRRTDRPRRKAQHDGGWGVCRGLRAAPAVAPVATAERRREEDRRKRGFAVVKRSSDPYNDFRSSMLEMIMERQIFGASDLQNLLRSYLCLNSPHLHHVILQAFSDIWVVLFGH